VTHPTSKIDVRSFIRIENQHAHLMPPCDSQGCDVIGGSFVQISAKSVRNSARKNIG
jgi:hypothetical protein